MADTNFTKVSAISSIKPKPAPVMPKPLTQVKGN